MIVLIGEKNMSWISDVNYEASKLEYSKKILRKFGITVGAVFGLLGVWFMYANILYPVQVLFIVLGIFLIFFGVLFPKFLKSIYRYWMTAAFVLGWFVSRILLTILFFVVLTPIALIAKLFKKEFLNLNYKQNQKSYWIQKTTSKINYEKMY